MKNWHLIKEYSYEKNQIICACDWFGDAGEAWLNHRKVNKDDPAPKGFNKKKLVYAAGVYHPTGYRDS